ncbi:hypothetical protein ACLB1Q_34505 [Escherichia coli]
MWYDYPVEEKSIIKELEERAQKYDWEGAKKGPLRTPKNQWMVDSLLPKNF